MLGNTKVKIEYVAPSFESLSADKQYEVVQQLKKENRIAARRTASSWLVTALVCSPAILYVTCKPVNDAVSLIYNAMAIAGKIGSVAQSASDAVNLTGNIDHPKIMAFLDTMAWAEGTGNAYDTAVGYTGADLWTYNSSLDSDAWGRYQYISTTAAPILAKLGFSTDDFVKPEVQDKVAIEHLKELGIYNKIMAGDLDTAICDAGSQWASFACSTAGQNPKSADQIKSIYAEKLVAREGVEVADTITSSVSSGGVVQLPSVVSSDTVTQWLVGAIAKPLNLKIDGLVPGGDTVNAGKFFPIQGGKPIYTSPFGDRIHPISGEEKFHYGQDIAADEGTLLLATEDATVTDVVNTDSDGCGLSVTYLLNNGDTVRYCHMNEVNVSVGDTLKAGQIVGEVGNTGSSTGAHLHFELNRDGQPIDPNSYLMSLGALESTQPPVIDPSTQDMTDFCIPMADDGKCASGVAVGKDLILTMHHVVVDAKGVVISDQDLTRTEFKYTVLVSDDASDLSLLKVPDANFTPVQLAQNDVNVNNSISTYGHNNGKKALTHLEQAVKSTDVSCGIQIKCAELPEGITGGFSGGRVMLGDKMVGINRSIAENDKTGRFVKISDIIVFMKKAGVL